MGDVTKKEEYVRSYQSKIEKAKVIVLTSCEGVRVGEMNALRKSIRATGAEMRVVKNTMVRRALRNLNLREVEPHTNGSTAIVFGYDDPVAPVKALFDFATTCKKFAFKGGVLEGKLLTINQLEGLSKLPGRRELLSMVASCMQGPLRNIVSVCQAPIRKLVYCLDALREKKEKEAA